MFWNRKKDRKPAAKMDSTSAPVPEVKAGDLRAVKATKSKYRVAAVKAKRKAQRRSRRACRLAAA